MNKYISILLIVVMAITQGCVSENEPEGPSLQPGESLPDFSISMDDGREVTTASLSGKIPVIVFFNTSCPDCQKELPIIQQLMDIYKDGNLVEILPISREETAKEIEAYWKANSFTMPYSPQTTREIYSLFASRGIPRIYIADTHGVITTIFEDTFLPSLQDLITAIENNDPTIHPSLHPIY